MGLATGKPIRVGFGQTNGTYVCTHARTHAHGKVHFHVVVPYEDGIAFSHRSAGLDLLLDAFRPHPHVRFEALVDKVLAVIELHSLAMSG